MSCYLENGWKRIQRHAIKVPHRFPCFTHTQERVTFSRLRLNVHIYIYVYTYVRTYMYTFVRSWGGKARARMRSARVCSRREFMYAREVLFTGDNRGVGLEIHTNLSDLRSFAWKPATTAYMARCIRDTHSHTLAKTRARTGRIARGYDYSCLTTTEIGLRRNLIPWKWSIQYRWKITFRCWLLLYD